MKRKIRLLAVTKDRIRYALSDIRLLTDQFISGVRWPADKDTLMFNLSRKDSLRSGIINDMVSKKHYVCRLSWVAHLRSLKVTGIDGARFSLQLKPFKNLAEHRKTEEALHKKYFLKTFKDYLSSSYEAEGVKYYTEDLPTTKAITVRKGNKIVGMLTLLELKDKTAFRPIQWITWIWIAPEIGKEQRLAVHDMLRGWLRRNSKKYIGASIHAANIRSQKWFLKSGFRPIRAFFARREVV